MVCVWRSWRCPEESGLFLRLTWTWHGVGVGRGDDGVRVLHGAAGGSPGRGVRVSGSGVDVRRKRPEAGTGHIAEWWALRAT